MANNPAYMTDQEAASKVCPMGVGANMNNRILIIDGLEAGRPCLGSKCAGWRYSGHWDDDEDGMVYDLELGYCGMVGID